MSKIKKTVQDLLTFVQRTGGFTTTDLERIMQNNGQTITTSNVQSMLYRIQVLSERKQLKNIQKNGKRYYTFSQQTINKMLVELQNKNCREVWVSLHIDKLNLPQDQLGYASLFI